MAPTPWLRVSRILWLACLLRLAPAVAAAGKALRGRPPALPEPPRAQGLARSLGCGAGVLRPACTPHPQPRVAEGTPPAACREALYSLPSPLSPEVASTLEGAPRAPRFLLPPIEGPCAAPGTVRSNPRTQPDAWGPRSRWGWGDGAGRPGMCGVSHHVTAPPPHPGNAARLPAEVFAVKCLLIRRAPHPICVGLRVGGGMRFKSPASHFLSGIFPKWTPGRLLLYHLHPSPPSPRPPCWKVSTTFFNSFLHKKRIVHIGELLGNSWDLDGYGRGC